MPARRAEALAACVDAFEDFWTVTVERTSGIEADVSVQRAPDAGSGGGGA